MRSVPAWPLPRQTSRPSPRERGTLRIGSFQAAGARILPQVLRRFLTEAPGVQLELTESVTDLEIVDGVERAELDLAFAVEPLRAGPFETRALLLDPFLLVVPTGKSVPELATGVTDGRLRVPVVCFRSCPSTRIVLTYLRERGIEPDVVLASDQNETLQGAVEAGLGAAVVPGSRSTSRGTRPTGSSSGRTRRPARSP